MLGVNGLNDISCVLDVPSHRRLGGDRSRLASAILREMPWTSQRQALKQLTIQTLNFHFGCDFSFQSHIRPAEASRISVEQQACIPFWRTGNVFYDEQRLVIEYTKLFDARPWQVTAYVADRFCEGRTFIVGDAAHSMPPTGGFGGNTGIHDAHNLAWKLALVTRGIASPALLETYDSERRPIAEGTLGQSLARLAAWFKNLGDRLPPPPQIIEDSAVILGQCYRVGAFVSQDGAGSELFEDPQAPSGRPGSRAPHVIVKHATGSASVHDLVGKHFLLLIGSEGEPWEKAAAVIAHDSKIELRTVRLAQDDHDAQSRVLHAYGVDGRGAVLIRPDGVIAWRSAGESTGAASELRAAIASVLGTHRAH